MNRLADFAEEHEAIAADFAAWLAAVVVGAAAPARAAFSRCAARLRAHAAMEEEHLLPLFASCGLESPGCTAAILHSEHAKILRALAALESRVAALPEPIPPDARVALVLDAHPLRELLRHHDQRERVAFFPALDAGLDSARRAALYAICARSQASAASRESSPPSSCNS